MPGKTKYPVFLFSFIFFILFRGHASFAQTQPYLDKKVSFTFSDMSLANVLRAIGTKTGVKFSYNPEVIQSGRRISMRFNNIPLRDVLKQLLNDPTISMREIGNQIVLYRGDPSQIPLEPNQQLIPGKPVIVTPPKKIPDTVYVYQLDTLVINLTDTIFRSISIIHYDTIRLTDTVYVEKKSTTNNLANNTGNGVSKNAVVPGRFASGNGFYSGFYFDWLPGDATYSSTSSGKSEYTSLMQNSVSGQSFKFATGLLAGYNYNWVGFSAGIGYRHLGEKFSYSYTIETGGFFETDTVEKYYTLAGIDTTWFYITDSTWIPKESEAFSVGNTNSYNYLDVPISVKIRFLRKSAMELYALGGINVNVLISADAVHINPDNFKDVVAISKNDLRPVLMSWHAGLGAAFKLSARSGVITEAVYRSQTASQYKDGFPLDKRYGNFGFKVAAFLKF